MLHSAEFEESIPTQKSAQGFSACRRTGSQVIFNAAYALKIRQLAGRSAGCVLIVGQDGQSNSVYLANASAPRNQHRMSPNGAR
jgi:Cys-tRNA synthase (O-phospho-L-seryl-tRNA:Cys-tRNA synthase)